MRINYEDRALLASALRYGWSKISGWGAELETILQSHECRFLPLKTFRYACTQNRFEWAAAVYFNQSDKLDPTGGFHAFLARTIESYKNSLDS